LEEEPWYEHVLELVETSLEGKVTILWNQVKSDLTIPNHKPYQSQGPRGLRRRSAAACLLRSWVRIPTGAWMFVCCECCVLSGRGLCDEPITRPEESYRL